MYSSSSSSCSMSSLSPRSNRYHHHQQQHSSSAFEMHERIETRTSTRHEHFEHAAGATVLRRLAAGSIIDLSDTRAPTLPPITAPINGHGATPIAGHVNRAATTRMMFLGTSLLTSHVDGTLALYTRQSTAPTSLALSNGVAAHTHSILCMEQSPYEQSHVITGSRDSKLHLWDVEHLDRLAIQTFDEHDASVVDCCFEVPHSSHIGQSMASVSSDKTLRLWRVDRRDSSLRVSLPSEASCVRFLHEHPHSIVTLHSPHTYYIWDLRKHDRYRESFQVPAGASQSNGCSSSPTATAFSTINTPSFSLQETSVWSRPVPSSSSNATTAMPLLGTLPWLMPSIPTRVAIPVKQSLQPESTVTISATPSPVFDKTAQRFETPFAAHKAPIHSMLLSLDGMKTITSCSAGVHKIWDLYTRKGLGTLSIPGRALASLARPSFLLDHQYLLCGYTNGELFVWNLSSASSAPVVQLPSGTQYPISATCVSQDDSIVAYADGRYSIRLLSALGDW